MPESNAIGPKRGDHVSSNQHNGIFEVVAVNALMQTANIRPVRRKRTCYAKRAMDRVETREQVSRGEGSQFGLGNIRKTD